MWRQNSHLQPPYIAVGENAGFHQCLYPGDKEEPGNLLDEVISLSLNGLSMFRTPEGLLLAVKP